MRSTTLLTVTLSVAILAATYSVTATAAVADRAPVKASVLDAAREVGDLDKSWTKGGRKNDKGSQVTAYKGLASHGSFQAERTGFERDSLSGDSDKDLRKSPISGGAESGALGVKSDRIDSDLAIVIERWPRLPPVARAEILATVQKAATDE